MSEKEIKKCYSCEVEMRFLGKIPFRTGGTSGGWVFLFKGWAELSEDTLPLHVYVCPKCKRTEFFMEETFRQE